MAKYVFVTGGVVSSLGKGIAAASLGNLLKYRGLNVNLIKLDPYVNVDPGTMSPFQHGEVFVTEDGSETDLDLGHYERFVDVKLGKRNNFTTGYVYEKVIRQERRGDYLGETVQIVPHIVDEIKTCITQDGEKFDITIVEVGGVVGDIESLPFLEAIRQLGIEQRENVAYVHLTLVPYLKAAKEVKTKPTQHSVRELRAIGIQPDFLLCRCERALTDEQLRKISLFTNVPPDGVIPIQDSHNIYSVPVDLRRELLDCMLITKLDLLPNTEGQDTFDEWVSLVNKMDDTEDIVRIAVVGKYAGLRDSYKSISEALVHAGIHLGVDVIPYYIKTEDLDSNGEDFYGMDGILVPGGFGERGMASKNIAIRYARENNIPFLGICLGMQLAVIEYARNVAGLEGADSTECDPDTVHPVVKRMAGFDPDERFGGTLRLGGQECELVPGTELYDAYNIFSKTPWSVPDPATDQTTIVERHRHRYEVNADYLDQYQDLVVSATNSEGYVEAVEIKGHIFFVATQFHPEYTSNPRRGHPIFLGFIQAAMEYEPED